MTGGEPVTRRKRIAILSITVAVLLPFVIATFVFFPLRQGAVLIAILAVISTLVEVLLEQRAKRRSNAHGPEDSGAGQK